MLTKPLNGGSISPAGNVARHHSNHKLLLHTVTHLSRPRDLNQHHHHHQRQHPSPPPAAGLTSRLERRQLEMEPVLGAQHQLWQLHRRLVVVDAQLEATQHDRHARLQLIHGEVLTDAVPAQTITVRTYIYVVYEYNY